jgi:hypothetical protein
LKKAEKRVAVAKDVLAQLADKKHGYVATPGHYITPRFTLGENEVLPDGLREALPFIQSEPCEVCGLGSLILSKARLYNKMDVDDVLKEDSFFTGKFIFSGGQDSLLEDLFSITQITMIEDAFEQTETGWYGNCSESKRLKAVEFGKRFDETEERLRAIMQNIIDNNGSFVP